MKTVAIVLAAGSGSRMNADVKKQFLELAGKPILYYSLNAFQNSFIDEIILVTSKEDIEFCKNEIVKKYDFNKVRCIVEGGRERYHSVMHGLKMIQSCDYVYVHDAARPLVDEEMLERLKAGVEEFGSAVAAVETKDTIKIVDNENYVISTPSRNTVWIIQTPQVFRFTTINEAYERLRMRLQNISAEDIHI
ncbi:MAG: 2-C-methyl-D-erythritol 4-phosphate cytidylyltransferase, partial [Lachnospiraceae bacterium]|nr:2-C-methyl-D-erythritol 4-phosphate cytidylyltransferase [Lachnospiraceae bacterium]